MSDYLKTLIEFERYFKDGITSRTNINYKFDTKKKIIMLDKYENNERLCCFCNSNILCPCDCLDEMLKTNKKCHCGFIKED